MSVLSSSRSGAARRARPARRDHGLDGRIDPHGDRVDDDVEERPVVGLDAERAADVVLPGETAERPVRSPLGLLGVRREGTVEKRRAERLGDARRDQVAAAAMLRRDRHERTGCRSGHALPVPMAG
jgi:hypothetical protein